MFVPVPICAASRATILTEKYERMHKFTFDTPPIAARKASAVAGIISCVLCTASNHRIAMQSHETLCNDRAQNQ